MAILGQDFNLVVHSFGPFRFLPLLPTRLPGTDLIGIFHLLCIVLHLVSGIYKMVFPSPLYCETFLFSFGLIASTICCVFTRGRSRSRGQRRYQPSTPQPPPLTVFSTRIQQQKPATSITTASPQPPAHLRSTSAPLSNRSPSRHSRHSKHDDISHVHRKNLILDLFYLDHVALLLLHLQVKMLLLY